MRKTPKVSVIITSYNQKKWLKEAISSVLYQSYTNIELIVVDDLSTDGSRDILINDFPDLHLIINQENVGVSASRNIGASYATGSWITFLDGDDFYLPDKIMGEMEIASKENDTKIIFSNFRLLENEIYRDWRIDYKISEKIIFPQVFMRSFPHGSLFRNELIAKDLWDKMGKYDENLSLYEDYDLKLKLTRVGKATNCSQTGSVYRIHDSGLSNKGWPEHYLARATIMKCHLNDISDTQVLNDCRSYYRQFLKSGASQFIKDSFMSGKAGYLARAIKALI